LVVSGRVLGPERYASLSALWALMFLAGPGLFIPVEQEVGRALSERRERKLGVAPVVKRAAVLAAILAAVLLVAIGIATPVILEILFDDQVLLLVGLSIGLIGYAAQYLVRGTLSGNGRFGPYGLMLGSEGVLRLAACAGLAVAGVSTAGPYGIVAGLAPFAAIAIALTGQRNLTDPGPQASWSELSGALGYLLAGSLLAQTLVNAGPIAVKFLAPAHEQAAAGRFLAGLVIARIPLFMFQAVQAALIPRLAGHAAAKRYRDFRSGLARLLVVVIGVGSLATLGAFLVGPWLVRFLFGPGFDLSRADLTYLAGASAVYMLALALAQALIAVSGHARVAVGWLVGVIGFALFVNFGSGLLLRVEQGFLGGAVAAAVAMALLMLGRLPKPGAPSEPLAEAAGGIPIEP
jgi:O-antigen/teichoic acid export membrane protein